MIKLALWLKDRLLALWRRPTSLDEPAHAEAPEAKEAPAEPEPPPAPPPEPAVVAASPVRPGFPRGLWLGAAALLFAAAGAFAAVLVMGSRESAALQQLKARQAALDEENRRHHSQPIIPAPDRPVAEAVKPSSPAPASLPAVEAPPRRAPVSGECLVSGEDDLRGVVHECITAFNRAAARRR